ncbi:MAG: phenylacetic acid degradation bifunctional protein PaaZ, partial [Bacteroidetes bacterium]|nr:phenylacetic acid degradation bifunctional protein PaaZ [Bacteroidota bacterium]
LTCKQKIERDSVGEEIPCGIVKWFVEVFDQADELVAVATILTMVQKKNPFVQLNRSNISGYLSRLTAESKPNWGIMTAQHMIEHLEKGFRMATGEISGYEIDTPEEKLAKTREMIFNYRPMPREFKHPLLPKDGLDALIHADLEAAKSKMLEAWDTYETFFSDKPDLRTTNAVFGMMDKFEWDLLNNKHMNHHLAQFGLI